jgi:hypothetical protein
VSDSEEIWILDRFEGDRVVLERALHEMLDLPRALLPSGAREGDALRVAVHVEGGASRLTLVRDEQETARRAAEVRRLQETLRGRDPGGDIKL